MTSIVEDDERRKYEAMWGTSSYRDQSDGLPVVDQALLEFQALPGETLVDWGCGGGEAAARFQMWGLKTTGFDIAANCLSPSVSIPLVTGTIWDPPHNLLSDYAFCTDVLEHIPPEHLLACLDVIAARTNKAAFIQIDTFPDISGPKMDPPTVLHLSLHSREWWLRELQLRWRTVISGPGKYTRWWFICRR